MNRLEKIKVLDELFFNLQTHICFENESQQIKLKDQIAKFGKFESLHSAWRKRQDRLSWLNRARESEVTIVEADGSEWIQNALEWRIARGEISKKDFELMG